MLNQLQIERKLRKRAIRTVGAWSARRDAVCLWLVMMLLVLATGSRAANFTISLDRDTITVGETATLTMTAEGGTPNPFPVLPPVANLQAYSQGQSSQITMVNGQVSSTVSETFAIMASQPGEYTIPSVTADIGGQQFKTDPVKLKVVKAGTPPSTANAANPELAILRLSLPKAEVYVGEVLPIQLELYLREGVANMRDFQLTPMQAEGFTVGKMIEGQQHKVRLGNVGYTVVPLAMSCTAVKAGKLELGPAQCTAQLLMGPFDFFGQPTRGQRVSPQSDTVEVQALPVPRNNAPPGFSGAVGHFSLTTEVSPTNVAVGDPITVKVQISGRGGMDTLTLPDQPAWQQFKVYPPTSEFQPSDQMAISGTKSFALTVVPQNMETKELPPFTFSFFDPDQKSFRTLTQPAVPLIVRPSAASLPPPSVTDTTATASTPARDIAQIKQRPGQLAQIAPPLAVRPWFLALQGVPVLAWAVLFVRRRQQEKLAGNPRLRRRLNAEQKIRSGLRELRRAANENAREEFFATLFRLLQEQLGARLDLPASAITEAVVEERLEPGDMDGETRDLVRELFQACNQARYAHQETNEDLVALVPKAEAALEGMREVRV